MITSPKITRNIKTKNGREIYLDLPLQGRVVPDAAIIFTFFYNNKEKAIKWIEDTICLHEMDGKFRIMGHKTKVGKKSITLLIWMRHHTFINYYKPYRNHEALFA